MYNKKEVLLPLLIFPTIVLEDDIHVKILIPLIAFGIDDLHEVASIVAIAYRLLAFEFPAHYPHHEIFLLDIDNNPPFPAILPGTALPDRTQKPEFNIKMAF